MHLYKSSRHSPGKMLFHASAVRGADHYAALGLSKGANPSEKDIKIAYFKVARACHPDAVRSLSSSEQAAAKKKFQVSSTIFIG
jgi:preprotein translocase subunit Sec63